MELKKPNDIFVATLNNPTATTYDLMSSEINPDNTSLYSKDEYKNSPFVKKTFTMEDGSFDDLSFDKFYQVAQGHYEKMTNENYLNSLDEVWYSPFDVTRPKEAKTFNVSAEFAKDINPFKQTYGRTSVFSVDESDLSMRELAQQGKIFDIEKGQFLEESVNDRSILGKLFGQTLVYAQWDEEGSHLDPISNRMVKHSKGDWKINDDGELFVETLGKREVYGKQVVNPMDALTTDGTLANKFDIFDSDNKESNALKTTLKIAAEIAPLFVPGVNLAYGGVKAAIGLSSALPTFYKSIEGLILGDDTSKLHNLATAAEGYMSKFSVGSVSDEAQDSLFNYEQIATMVSDIFAQIHEQRAMASLSKLFYHPKATQLSTHQQKLIDELNTKLRMNVMYGNIKPDDLPALQKQLVSKVPGLMELQKSQSAMAKSFSLGYMALTSTASIYGEAIEAGYDRRTAGFAGLMAASGTYALMMNNRMGDWFLDKTTGYTVETNKALMRKALKEYMDPIQEGIKALPSTQGKMKLVSAVSGIKGKFSDMMTNSSVIGEALWKNSIIEGIEEVSEELVIDATKGVVDVMSTLGLTKKKGTFGGLQNVFSAQGFERYVAALLGGTLGGALFEFNRAKIEPWIAGQGLSQDTKESIYEFVANGHTDLLIQEVNKQRKRLGNNYIAPMSVEGETITADENKNISQADAIADATISMIRNIDGLMNNEGLIMSDSEIVDKAIRDFAIIRDLERTKGETNKVGIEGLIIDDVRRHSKALTDINAEIQKLSALEGDNKETISNLQEKAKIHRNTINDILEGKKALDYFEQAVFYLNKDISEHWAAIDLNTFVKTQYNKDYYELPESGLGITKESVRKEWNQYLESKDLRSYLDLAWNAYKDLEKKSNKSTVDYSETGYAEQRKKTLKKLMDVSYNKLLFNTSNAKDAENNIQRFLTIARAIEDSTGKRVIPWDSMIIDAFDKFNKEGLFVNESNVPVSDDKLNEKVVINEEERTKKELISEFLVNSFKSVPADAVTYDVIMSIFNGLVNNYNQKLEEQKVELETSINDSNKDEVEKQIEQLENNKLDIGLTSAISSKTYLEQEAGFQRILEDHMLRLNLTPEILQGFTSDVMNKNLLTYSETIAEYAKKNNKEVTSLTNEELLEALSDFLTIVDILGYDANHIENILNSDSDQKFTDLEQFINRISEIFPNYKESVKEYKDISKSYYDSIKLPELFNAFNYTIEAILKQIKEDNNLDEELVLKIEEIYSKFLDEIKTEYLKSITISNNDFINLIENITEIRTKFAVVSASFQMGMEEYGEIPKYLIDIIKNSSNKLSTVEALDDSLIMVNNNLSSIKESINKLSDLKEVIDNKEKFITNTIYDFLNKFMLSLEDETKKREKTIFDILKEENLSLFNASDITNYIREGFQEKDILQAINVLKMLKSVVFGTSTTELTLEDPYGLIALRKNFAKKHSLDSDVKNLKTITSDVASLIITDLDRIQTKLEFLVELSKNNSGKLFIEQELIRTKTNKELLKGYELLLREKPDVPDFPDYSDIMETSESDEKKLLEIENVLFEFYNTKSKEEKIALVKALTQKFKFNNVLEQLYDKDGSNRITKDIKALSNNDFLLYLVSNIVINSKDFNNRLLEILKSKEFDKSPFFTQELSVRITYASIVEPELFSELVKDTAFEFNNLTDLITYILGDAGTGKTTVLFKLITLLLKNNNPNLNIWFSAPHIDKVNDLNDSVLGGIDFSNFTTSKFDKKQLFDKLGLTDLLAEIKKENSPYADIVENDGLLKFQLKNIETLPMNHNNEDLPDVIFIDEISHFDALELELLNEFSKRSLGKKFVKIIGAGDYVQLGATSKELQNISYNIDRVSGIFVPQLSLSVRSANNQKRENADYLSTIVKKSILLRETEEDNSKVLDLIGKGILLKGHLSKDIIAGEIISQTNLIPKDVLETLKRIIDKDPSIKIGVLSSNINELDDNLSKQFELQGISLTNIKIFSPENIQGSEVDYFIVPKSLIKGSHILDSLRKLYTYMTRSKQATIILNDEGIINKDRTELNLYFEKQDTSTMVTPLKEEVIQRDKEERIKKLTELLSPDFAIKYDFFKFSPTGSPVIDEDSFLEDSLETTEQPEYNPTIIKDKFNYRLHTFYNDLNVKVINTAKGKTLVRNKNSEFSYGLDFLFEDKDSIDLSNEDFEKYTEALVQLKNELWRTSQLSATNKFKPKNDDTILRKVFKGAYKVSTKLIVKKSVYDEEYNAPFGKLLDDSSKHLTTGQPFYNLFLKVTNEDGTDYYIHLATFPLLETVKTWFDKDIDSYNKYKDYLDSLEDELEVKKETLKIRTSTRLVKSETPVRYTLEQLSKIKGLYFLDDKDNFTKTPTVKIYPSGNNGFEEFKKLYAKTTFGDPISEEKLKEMYYGKIDPVTKTHKFSGYKGKPYIAVTFLKDMSQVQYVLLKHDTRTLSEIEQLVKKPLEGSNLSAKQLILDKQGESAKEVTDTLFNGNQVLNMLISLAVKKPELFNKFFEDGQSILDETRKKMSSDSRIKDIIEKYIPKIKSMFDSDLLENVTYYSKDKPGALREVYTLIKNELEIYKKTNKPISESELKKKLNEKIQRNPDKKYWFSRFWNLFSFKNEVDAIVSIAEAEPNKYFDEIIELHKQYKNTLEAIINFWKAEFSDKFYYNVPITISGKSFVGKNIDSNLNNTYITLTPESPYFNLDLTDTSVEISKDLDKLKSKLSGIKYNSTSILNSDPSDTTDSLNQKIVKAKLIKSVLEHKNNSGDYTLDDLISLDDSELKKKIKILDNKTLTLNKDEVINQLSKLVDDTLESDPIQNLINTINRGLSDPSIPKEDQDVLNHLINKWNDKVFPGNKSLYDFLSDLPKDVESIIDFYAELPDVSETDSFMVMGDLTYYILSKIGVYDLKINQQNRKYTDNIFEECNI